MNYAMKTRIPGRTRIDAVKTVGDCSCSRYKILSLQSGRICATIFVFMCRLFSTGIPCVLVADEVAVVKMVDATTLSGKVMCGYQGWFNCEDDGAGLGWTHWAAKRSKVPGPGNVTVDLWPDVSELDADERYATDFRHSDGRIGEVFSSGNRKTVLRHFQ